MRFQQIGDNFHLQIQRSDATSTSVIPGLSLKCRPWKADDIPLSSLSLSLPLFHVHTDYCLLVHRGTSWPFWERVRLKLNGMTPLTASCQRSMVNGSMWGLLCFELYKDISCLHGTFEWTQGFWDKMKCVCLWSGQGFGQVSGSFHHIAVVSLIYISLTELIYDSDFWINWETFFLTVFFLAQPKKTA